MERVAIVSRFSLRNLRCVRQTYLFRHDDDTRVRRKEPARLSWRESPDDAIVVREGRNRAEDIEWGMGMHPSGVTGISVECARGIPIAELAGLLPHAQIGVTTVGLIRQQGGDVLRTSGRSPKHATLIGLSPENISRLLTPTTPNPARSDSSPGRV